MDFHIQFGFDEIKETEGVWRDLPDAPGIQLLIGRFQNENFQYEMLKLRQDNEAKLRSLPEGSPEFKTLQRDLMVAVMAKTVLLGWRGDVIYGGEPLPYTLENSVKLLKLRSFRDIVLGMSLEEQQYRADMEAAEEKN